MRRKSGRSGKASPDRTASDSPKKSRRQSSRRRKRSSSRSSIESEDAVEKANYKESAQDSMQNNSTEDTISSSGSKITEENVIKSKLTGTSESPERKSSKCASPLTKSDDPQEREEGTEEKEEKKNKGKSKGKNKTNIEQSSNNIEPEIEHENVQGTPQSPSNDNADNENVVQNVNDAAKADMEEKEEKSRERESEAIAKDHQENMEAEVNFESEYAQESLSEKCHELDGDSCSSFEKGDRSKKTSSKRSSKDERSTTPEIKDSEDNRAKSPSKKLESTHEDHKSRRKSSDQSIKGKSDSRENTSSKKKITLRRSPPQSKETEEVDNSEVRSPHKERRSTTEDSGKETEESEEKPRKKITLKRLNVEERTDSNEEKVNGKDEGDSTRQSSSKEFGEKKRRLSSLCEEKGHEGEGKPKKPSKRIKLIRSLSRVNEEGHDEKSQHLATQRRQKWNRSDWLDKLTYSFYKVDVDSIKIICPSLEFLGENEVHLETAPRERRKSESDLKRKVSMDKSDDSDRPDYEKQTSEDSSCELKIELNPNIIAMNRKISIVDDTASKLRPPPSPAKNPISDVLYITNLVRPFTVKQLKELLERTGKIKEDGFWTDRIKSKCYVHYESIEEAEATRNALHGVHWPIGNGKKLVIDFATVEDMEKAKNPAPVPKPILDKVPEKENREPVKLEEKHKDREREERKRRDGPVREWDLGKEDSHRGRSRSRSRERVRRHSRRSYTPDDYIHRKQRKVEDPVPQKLMDDLFLKTKATPSIYWQPLSPEEIATKQKQRLVRMEEHKRRIEETRVRLRESRRGSFRRR